MSGYMPDKAAAQEPDTEPGWTEQVSGPQSSTAPSGLSGGWGR